MSMTPSSRPERRSSVGNSEDNQKQLLRRWWRNLNIRAKTTALAIALGTIPVLSIGALSYVVSNRAIVREIARIERTQAIETQELINIFMRDRFIAIQTLADLDIFTDAERRESATKEERTDAIERFKSQAGDIYDSIGVFDLAGNVLAETPGAKPLGNHLNRTYIQKAKEANGPVLGQPAISSSSGIFSVYAASVIKDKDTGKAVGYVRTRIPVEVLENLLMGALAQDSAATSFYLIDNEGQVFLGPEGTYLKRVGSNGETLSLEVEDGTLISKGITEIFNDFIPTEISENTPTILPNSEVGTKQLLSYSQVQSLEGLPELGWSTLLTTDVSTALAPQRQLLLTLLLGSVIAALLSVILGVVVARRATRPILAATKAVNDIGTGNLSTRLRVDSSDELGQLSNNINRMASQLDESERFQTVRSAQSSLLASITAISPELPDVARAEELTKVMTKTRQLLNSDRLLLVSVRANSTETIIAESVKDGYLSILEQRNDYALLTSDDLMYLRDAQIINRSDISQSNIPSEQLAILRALQIQADLVIPIIGQNQFFGALAVHHCETARIWQERDIELLQQVAQQLGILFVVEEFSTLAEEQRQLKETLQQRALDLMIQVDPVSQGDLTVRARVTEDEIGTLADSYNATIESLQKLVTQVQFVAKQVVTTAGSNEVAVQTLSEGATVQTDKITTALDRIQSMVASTQTVSLNAEQAAQMAQQTAVIVESGDLAMNRTVDGITAIRETVAETTKKVKNLGESSQKISKVVNLIDTFAAQTNLLALNASIEAARAGEEGRGFAVVADEVRSLAYQSAEAASDIEKLVADIQSETNEVVSAMETGTEQVVSGTKLVQETKQSLTEITMASTQIRELVAGIVQATEVQSSNADAVTQTIESVASISDQTTKEVNQVSKSFNELLTVAQDLQQSIDQFKVN